MFAFLNSIVYLLYILVSGKVRQSNHIVYLCQRLLFIGMILCIFQNNIEAYWPAAKHIDSILLELRCEN